MADPFIGEIKLVGFSFAPKYWALCNGQIMQIVQNQALYSLLGTTYGGDGKTTFALPDLQGRTPIHYGQGTGLRNHIMGEKGGTESETITVNSLPSHAHPMQCLGSNGTAATPQNNVPAGDTKDQPYTGNISSLSSMNINSVASTGGNQSHANMMPFLALNFCIALQGIYPSRG